MATNPYQQQTSRSVPGHGLHPVEPVVRTNAMALSSLVLGLGGLFTIIPFFGVPSVLALVFGVVSRRRISAARGQQHGRGLALAGAILGVIGIAVIVTLVVGATVTALLR